MKRVLGILISAIMLSFGLVAFTTTTSNEVVETAGKCTGPKHVQTFQCLSQNTNPCSDTTGCDSETGETVE